MKPSSCTRSFAAKGTAIAISDVGVGVACCRAALLGASLNVFINTKSMTDRTYAEAINQKCEAMIDKYVALADQIFAECKSTLLGTELNSEKK